MNDLKMRKTAIESFKPTADYPVCGNEKEECARR